LIDANDRIMTAADDRLVIGLAASAADAAALAGVWGPGRRIGFGAEAGTVADIVAPAGIALSRAEIAAAVARRAQRYMFTFGIAAGPVFPDVIGPIIETLMRATGIGFCAACLAAPANGRTQYQGHLFQGASLLGNPLHEFAMAMEGRVGLVPHEIVAAGTGPVRRRLADLKDQGVALALIDAVSEADGAVIAAACAGQILTAGPAWPTPDDLAAEPVPPAGPVAILSGAVDRQTLFQLGVAAAAMPKLQLDFRAADPVADASTWAAPKIGQPFIIAASAPPDRLDRDVPVDAILAAIARALIADGITRLVVTGSATAGAVVAGLGIKTLTAGAPFGPLRWLETAGVSLLIKPGGAGGRDFFGDLFRAEFRPHIRLNAAAE
jgi:uncharacterized protein YgbK (DUF1537 family)